MSLTSVTAAITSSQIKFFVKRIDEKILLRFGFFLYALSMALVPFIVSFGEVVIPVIVYGIGMGINIPCLTSLLTSLAPLEHRAAFLSINSMMLRVGQTLGPVIMGYFFGIWGIPGVFYAGAGCALLMVATAAIMVR